jgi:hypothetical protein
MSTSAVAADPAAAAAAAAAVAAAAAASAIAVASAADDVDADADCDADDDAYDAAAAAADADADGGNDGVGRADPVEFDASETAMLAEDMNTRPLCRCCIYDDAGKTFGMVWVGLAMEKLRRDARVAEDQTRRG